MQNAEPAMHRSRRDRAEGEDMTDRAAKPGVIASQRQLMQYLRGGNWVTISKLPISVGPRLLDRITQNGWIESRGAGARCEVKLTAAGLEALQAPI